MHDVGSLLFIKCVYFIIIQSTVFDKDYLIDMAWTRKYSFIFKFNCTIHPFYRGQKCIALFHDTEIIFVLENIMRL